MKTQITATLIVCGALLASASSASAMELAGWQWWTAEGWQWQGVSLEPETTPLSTDQPSSTALASTEFGGCLLNDEPIDIETLVDCRSDACLGRKFYYGL